MWLAKPETARRVRQRIGTVLDWAYASGYRESEAPMRAITNVQHSSGFCGRPFCGRSADDFGSAGADGSLAGSA
ncbi:phage integrase central domain-containing protein [Sphingobium indicum]|uniref:phage integrase central domain-containing protein n=1 Tax=Sphingobium indicum TaxID=332055 RepID=UPI0039948243